MKKTNIKREFSKRLHELCDDMKISSSRGRQTELARKFAVSQESARKWLEGESIPIIERLDEICDWAEVNFEWLIRGQGVKKPNSMLYTTDDPQIIHVARQMEVMTSVGKNESVSRIDGINELIEKLKHNGTQ